jgi:hypothetical protein
VRNGLGFKYCTIDGGRTPSRSEARMATRDMKRAIEARRSLWKERERATVATVLMSAWSYQVGTSRRLQWCDRLNSACSLEHGSLRRCCAWK